MKKAKIETLIKKYLASSLTGYNVHGDLIYKVENSFFLKGYYFESRGNEDLDIAVWYFIQPLFVKKDGIILTLGDRLSYKRKINIWQTKKFEWWDAKAENLEKTFKSILDTILTKSEKNLNELKDVEALYNKFYKQKKDNVRIYEAVAYSTVLFAPISLQNKSLLGLIKYCSSNIKSDEDVVEIKIKNDATTLLNANDTEARLDLLKAWANETKALLKLPGIAPFK